MEKYTIGETAKLSGLSTKTIRFYEDAGVITTAGRRDNGYRTYSQSAVDELKVLKYARDLGLPLAEIKKLMVGCDKGDCQHSREEVQRSIENYLTLLKSKIEQMKILEERLVTLNQKLTPTNSKCDGDKYCCNILHQLIDESDVKGGEKA